MEILGSTKDSYIFPNPLGQSAGEADLKKVMEKTEQPLRIDSRYN